MHHINQVRWASAAGQEEQPRKSGACSRYCQEKETARQSLASEPCASSRGHAVMLSAEENSGMEASNCEKPEPEREPQAPSKPWFVYPLLAAAIFAVSSAAVTFTSMSEITPFLLASWRLQITSALLFPAGVYSIWSLSAVDKWRLLRQLPLVLGSGVLMGAHFGTWVVCIENTSLAHALLVGSSPPIIIAIGTWILRQPISRGELIGTGIAAVGGVLICQSAGNEKAVSLYGDAIGLLCALFFVIYLAIGRALRSWMPIFVYVLPVNATAAIVLCCAALSTEGASFARSPNGLFGYLSSWSYCWKSVYLGAVPGIAGHVSFNALLKWLDPLIIALPGTTEPLIGILLGLALGVGTLPGLFTYLGGIVLIAATIIVIISSYKREKAEASEQASKQVPTVALAEDVAEKGISSAASEDLEQQALLVPKSHEQVEVLP